ncbi:MAG: insulinase family protein [Acholeplasmataceae bacterium]
MKFIQSDYKTIQLTLYMIDFDDVKKRAYRFLLAKMLSTHTQQYKTKQALSQHLQSLYGANFNGRSMLIGNLNIIQTSFIMVNPMIVNDLSLIDQMIDIFKDMIIGRDFFSTSIFEEEKRMLIEQWDAIEDQKGLYASIHFNQLLFGEHPYGYPQSGYKEDILAVTLDDLYTYFLEVLMSNRIYFIINGYFDGYEQKIKLAFKDIENNQEKRLYLKTLEQQQAKEKTEYLTMNQALIKIGYYLPILRNDPLYEAALLFDLMIGGYVDSIMFKIIREELNLCYDVRSSYDPIKGTFVIGSGVDQKRKEEAISKIFEIMDHNGNYELQLDGLKHAKQYLIHQIKSSYDEQIALTLHAFYEDLFEQTILLDQRIEKIEKVTLDQVKSVYLKLQLQATYVLTGDKNDH